VRLKTYQKEYREKNREKTKKYREDNREKIRAYGANRDKEKRREYSKKIRLLPGYKEKKKKYDKKYRENDKGQLSEEIRKFTRGTILKRTDVPKDIIEARILLTKLKRLANANKIT
jgi:hypothetical protein